MSAHATVSGAMRAIAKVSESVRSVANSPKAPTARLERKTTCAQLWLVGEIIARGRKGGFEWDFCGLFSTSGEADQACLNSRYFMAPATVNEAIGPERHGWPGIRFPRGEVTS